jgi:hypothetical protein
MKRKALIAALEARVRSMESLHRAGFGITVLRDMRALVRQGVRVRVADRWDPKNGGHRLVYWIGDRLPAGVTAARDLDGRIRRRRL